VFPAENLVVLGFSLKGGWNMGSIAIRIIFYKKVGIILPRTGPSTYIQGFEFAYNITGCKLSSSIKSKPKIYIIF
jgi:hypothetical protein